MPTLHYQITLNDDVILSANCSSAEHASLDYIPGGTLLGVLAGRLYQSLNPDEAFTVFHSGKVRFNNAYIDQSLPLPFSWHAPKNAQVVNETGQIQRDQVFDLSYQSPNDMAGQQPKQMRQGYINAAYQLSSPYSGYRLKTAIDPLTGRAKDSQLFGYQHLNKGQHFFGSIVFDNDFDDALQETIKDQLQCGLRLGRSKNSQYGRVSLQWLDNVPAHTRRLISSTGSQSTDKKMTLWCLSDCCLHDTETGQPILQIQARHLGLEGDIIPDQTFIRTRRYIPYNTYRRGHELERQVISKGSVISIQLKEAIDEQSLIALETQGIGLYKEQGLGQIAINHPWLAVNYQPIAKEQVQKTEQEKEPIVINAKDSPLLHWLEQQDSPDQRLQQNINDVIDSLKQFYQIGRRFSAVATQQSYGLSTTQWGHLYDIAKSNRTIEQLDHALFSASDALCKFEHNEEWTLPRNEKGHSMMDWLMAQFKQLQEKVAEQSLTERDLSLILTRVAKKVRTQNEQWLKGANLSIAGGENK